MCFCVWACEYRSPQRPKRVQDSLQLDLRFTGNQTEVQRPGSRCAELSLKPMGPFSSAPSTTAIGSNNVEMMPLAIREQAESPKGVTEST